MQPPEREGERPVWDRWFWAPLLLVVGGGALAWRVSWLFFGDVARPFPAMWEDDGFYSLTVSRNIALGLGETIDAVTPTNGFQPLYVWLVAGVVELLGLAEDSLAVLRTAQTLQLSIALLQGYLVYRIAGRVLSSASAGAGPHRLMQTIVGTAMFANVVGLSFDMNGLETRLASLAVLVVLSVWLHQADASRPVRGGVFLGLAAAMAFLARLDSVFFLTALGLASLVQHRASRTEVLRWVVAGCVCAILAAPYLWHNYAEFGSIVPLSGEANVQLAGDGSALTRSIDAVRQAVGSLLLLHIAADLHYGTAAKLAFSGLALALTLALVAAGRSRGPSTTMGERAPTLQTLLLTLTLWGALLLAYYGVVQRFGSLARYLEPWRVLAVLTLLLGLTRWVLHAGSRRAYLGLVVLVTAHGLALVFYAPYLLEGRPGPARFRDFGSTVLAGLADQRPAGVPQSGYAGYWFDGIVNLDGKVNPGTLSAIVDGDLADYALEHELQLLGDPSCLLPRGTDPQAAGDVPIACEDLRRLFDDPRLRESYRLHGMPGELYTFHVLRAVGGAGH